MKGKSKQNENGWKDKLTLVYSTNPDYRPATEETVETSALPPSKQNLRVMFDKKGRGGKSVTLVTGFVGNEEDLLSLGKMLKSKLGVGGSVKEGEILVQGSFVEKIMQILIDAGYKVKRVGG